jgi:hypothetical protein
MMDVSVVRCQFGFIVVAASFHSDVTVGCEQVR